MALRFTLLVVFLSAACAPNKNVVFTGGHLFDVVAGALVENGALVVEDGVITARIPVGGAIPSVDGEHIDATDMTIMPGLWEAHAHLIEEDSTGSLGLLPRAWELHTGVPYKKRAFLEHGITTLRDPGGAIDSLKLRNGDFHGQHIYAAGRLFVAPGGYPVHAVPAYLRGRAVYEVDDPVVARQDVDEAAVDLDGVSFIKVVYTSGVLKSGEFDPTDPNIATLPHEWFDEVPIMKPDVLAAVIDEAHKLGLQVAVHTDRFSEAKEAVDAGVDYLHHTWPMPQGPDADAFLQTMVDRHVCWNPTLDVYASRAPELSPSRFDAARRGYAAGIKMVAGSDTGVFGSSIPWGESLVAEMRFMIDDAGVSTMDAWRAATINSAECLGKGGTSGSLDVGKDGDVVLVRGDPVNDIDLFIPENMEGVWISGERFLQPVVDASHAHGYAK